MTTKKNEKNENTGKKGLYAQFDESRFLRLGLLEWVWIEDNVLPGRAINIGTVMANLSRARFLQTVLQAAFGIVHNKPKISEEDIVPIFDGYIENTGDLEDLTKLLTDVYELSAKNPMKAAKAKEEKTTEVPSGNESPASA